MYNHNTQPMHNQDSAIHLHKYTSYGGQRVILLPV